MMSRLAAKDIYEKRPFKPKYIRVEVRTGPIIREVIRIEVVGQTVETGGQYGNNRPNQNYRDNNY